MNKRLFYNIIQFNRQPAALCSNDRKSCYNRRVAALAMCQLGGTINGIKSMVEMLATMKHHIFTGVGDLKRDKAAQIGRKP